MSAEANQNIDHTEREKFDSIASGWWDPEGPFRPLHDLNPSRLKFVMDRAAWREPGLSMWAVAAAFWPSPWRKRRRGYRDRHRTAGAGDGPFASA